MVRLIEDMALGDNGFQPASDSAWMVGLEMIDASDTYNDRRDKTEYNGRPGV
jgi:hypothetical protein